MDCLLRGWELGPCPSCLSRLPLPFKPLPRKKLVKDEKADGDLEFGGLGSGVENGVKSPVATKYLNFNHLSNLDKDHNLQLVSISCESYFVIIKRILVASLGISVVKL